MEKDTEVQCSWNGSKVFYTFYKGSISWEHRENPEVHTGFVKPVSSNDLCNDKNSLCQTRTSCYIFIVLIYPKNQIHLLKQYFSLLPDIPRIPCPAQLLLTMHNNTQIINDSRRFLVLRVCCSLIIGRLKVKHKPVLISTSNLTVLIECQCSQEHWCWQQKQKSSKKQSTCWSFVCC